MATRPPRDWMRRIHVSTSATAFSHSRGAEIVAFR
jgi:hypothetical protein